VALSTLHFFDGELEKLRQRKQRFGQPAGTNDGLSVGKRTQVEMSGMAAGRDTRQSSTLTPPNLTTSPSELTTPDLPKRNPDGTLPRIQLGKQPDMEQQPSKESVKEPPIDERWAALEKFAVHTESKTNDSNEQQESSDADELKESSKTKDSNKPKDGKKKHHHKKPSFWKTVENVGITVGACLGESVVDYYLFNMARQKDQQEGDGTGKRWQDTYHQFQAGVIIPGTTALLTRFSSPGSAAGFLSAQLCATNDMLYYWGSHWLPGHGHTFKRADGQQGSWDSGYPDTDNIDWMNWSPAAWGPKLLGLGSVHHDKDGKQTITKDAFQKEAAIGGGLALGLPILGQVLGLDNTIDDGLGDLTGNMKKFQSGDDKTGKDGHGALFAGIDIASLLGILAGVKGGADGNPKLADVGIGGLWTAFLANFGQLGFGNQAS
jgi:hypothetical protein